MSKSPDSIRVVAAEQNVIGACLLSSDVYSLVADKLRSSDFTDMLCRRAWDEIALQAAGGRAFDVVTVGEALPGDLPILAAIARDTPSTANAQEYARLVRNAAELRTLAAIGAKIQALAYTERHAADARNKAAELLSVNEAPESGPVLLNDLLQDWVEDLRVRFESQGELLGLPIGLADIDQFLAGFCPGRLYVIGGRPAMGKSVIGLQAALTASFRERKPTLIFTLEMPASDLIYRAAACAASIGLKPLMQGDVGDDDWPRLTTFIASHKDTQLWIDDSSGLHIRDICARATRLHRRQKLGLIVIDYLQLVSGDGENRSKEVGSISRALKALSKELSVPVLALSQVSRECEKRTDKRPIMADLRESGEVEQDADMVAFLYRDEEYNKDSAYAGMAEFLVRKNRHGQTGMIPLQFDGAHSRFRDLSRDSYLDAQETAITPRQARGFRG